MLDIGLSEVLLILAVALIVIGPKRLPELAKSLGRGLAEFRRASDDLRRSILMDEEPEFPSRTRTAFPPKPPPPPEPAAPGKPSEAVEESSDAARERGTSDAAAPQDREPV